MENLNFSFNKRFRGIFNINDIYNLKFELSNRLNDLLRNGVVQKDGCTFFKQFLPEGPLSEDLQDKTGNEAFYNKIQIDAFSRYPENHDDVYFKEGIVFALELTKSLASIKESFNIYLLYDKEYCTIVFHQKRIGEYWLVDNLDKYSEDAVLLIELSC